MCLCSCDMCWCVQAGSLEREVQAIDSEFKGVQQSDHSRLAQLMCHTVRCRQAEGQQSCSMWCSLMLYPQHPPQSRCTVLCLHVTCTSWPLMVGVPYCVLLGYITQMPLISTACLSLTTCGDHVLVMFCLCAVPQRSCVQQVQLGQHAEPVGAAQQGWVRCEAAHHGLL